MSILDCYGQQRAIQTLQQARKARRIPHSYIFYGPEGVGKQLLAIQWAKLLLCAEPIQKECLTDTSTENDIPPKNITTQNQATTSKTTNRNRQIITDCCDKCQECHLVNSGSHPDLHIIGREMGKLTTAGTKSKGKAFLYISIDVIREFVIAPASMYPVRHRAKIFIIPDAHTMNRAAQNALLKTLEEPQDKTFIILITSQPNLLLPTIHSRCQSIRFNTLSKKYIYQQLIKNNINSNQAEYWAGFCQGQLGLALKLSSMGIFDWTEELIEKIATLDYNSALQSAQWLIEKSQLYGGILTENSNDFTSANATRQGYLYILQSIAHIFGSVLRFSAKYQYKPTAQINTGTNKFDTFITKIAGKLDILSCCKVIEDIQQAEKLLAANVNPSLIFESLLLKYLQYTKKLIA